MISNFKRTANWLSACGKTPSEQNASTQVGVHLEEISEFLREVTIISNTGISHNTLQEIAEALSGVGVVLKKGYAQAAIYDHEAALDALCDAEVTGNGVAYLLNYDKPGADLAVLAANEAKLNDDGTPVILDGGKIGKKAGWTAPDIAPFVANAITFQAA